MDIKIWKGYKKNILEVKKESTNKFKSYLNNPAIKDIINFGKFVVINGVFINYFSTIIFGVPFEIYTIPGYGLAWWYSTEEVPRVLLDFVRRAHK